MNKKIVRKLQKALLILLLISVVLYLSFGAILYFGQRDMIYSGSPRAIEDCNFPEGVEIWNYQDEVGLFTPAEGKKLFIFYHGNAENACNWRFLGPNHTAKLGYNTLVLEYPGYAEDGRVSNLDNLYETARVVNQWLAGQDYEHIVVSGYSLGTGVATYHDSVSETVDQLVLFAPYDSIKSITTETYPYYPSWLLRDNFDSVANLKDTKTPVYIVHGAKDWVVPAARSEALQNFLKAQGTPVQRWIREESGHNSLLDSPFLDNYLSLVLK